MFSCDLSTEDYQCSIICSVIYLQWKFKRWLTVPFRDQCFHELAAEYSDVHTDQYHIDILSDLLTIA
jgi:hypothetical protein